MLKENYPDSYITKEITKKAEHIVDKEYSISFVMKYLYLHRKGTVYFVLLNIIQHIHQDFCVLAYPSVQRQGQGCVH